MKYYADITLLPSDEIGHYFLWSKVYQQVHLALVDSKNADGYSAFGVTFPEFSAEKHKLGCKLRLFGPDTEHLHKLNISRWLTRLSDYVHVTGVRQTPERVDAHIRFKRLRTKSSIKALARRAAKRHGISYEHALKDREGFEPQLTDAPFIQMTSSGNGHLFRLFIGVEQAKSRNADIAVFSTYGLSKKGFLPMF